MGRFHHVLDNRSFEYGSLRTDWLHSCLVAKRFKLTEPRTGTLDKDSRGLTTKLANIQLGKHLASIEVENGSQLPISRAGSNGRCNTIWYEAVFKGGVYETRETVWAFGGAETRRVASLESRADAA